MSTEQPDTLGQLQTIFVQVFRSVNVDFALTLSMDNTPQWTSLRHVRLLSGIEKQFGVEFEPTQIAKLTSVRAIVEFLGTHQ
jgi:acyl carrier protein